MAKLSTDKQERKEIPIGTGVLDYFPDALAAVAQVSYIGNQQHNPGQPLHWERSKSTDHADCIIRHYMERGTVDVDGTRHSAKMAWRALALLQLELEAESVPDATGYSHELDRPIATPNRSPDALANAPNGHGQLQSHTTVPNRARIVVSEKGPAEGNWSR